MQVKFNINNSNCTDILNSVCDTTPITLELFVSNCESVKGEKIGVPYLWGVQVYDDFIYNFSIQSLFSCLEYLIDVGAKIIYTFSCRELFAFIRSSYTLTNDTLRSHDGDIHKFGFSFYNKTLVVRSLKSISGSNTIESFCGMPPQIERRVMCPGTILSSQVMNRLKSYLKSEENYLIQLLKKYRRLENIPNTLSKTIQQDLTLSCFAKGKSRYQKILGYYDSSNGIRTLPIADETHFRFLEKSFQGGFVGYNNNHVNEEINNVYCNDFVSSYIACMLAYKYPMAYKTRYANPSLERVNYVLSDSSLGFICEVQFTNIKSISPCKCIKCSELIDENDPNLGVRSLVHNDGAKFTNDGGLISANSLTLVTTSVDYSYYNKFYTWDEVKFLYIEIYTLDYLPNEYTSVVKDLFYKKSINKCNPDTFVESVAKKKVNISYGLTVTGFWRVAYSVDDNNFVKNKTDLSKVIDDYNNFRGRFFNRVSAYQWGVFCTAYARRALFSIISKLGDDWLYSDTDSVYYIYKPEHVEMINRYNNMIENLLAQSPIIKSKSDFIVKSNFCDKVYHLGSMDLDKKYTSFKFLKPKTYLGLSDDGSYKLVLSGCSNFNSKFFETVNPFEWFDLNNKDGRVPLEYCDTYNDFHRFEAGTYEVIDYRGRLSSVTLPGGCYRIFTDFKLTSSDFDNIEYALGL